MWDCSGLKCCPLEFSKKGSTAFPKHFNFNFSLQSSVDVGCICLRLNVFSNQKVAVWMEPELVQLGRKLCQGRGQIWFTLWRSCWECYHWLPAASPWSPWKRRQNNSERGWKQVGGGVGGAHQLFINCIMKHSFFFMVLFKWAAGKKHANAVNSRRENRKRQLNTHFCFLPQLS